MKIRFFALLIVLLVVSLALPTVLSQGCDPATGRGCDDGGDGGDGDGDNGGGSGGGTTDSDGDGIADGADLCPRASGPASFSGCPDTDGDGTPDNTDQCPNEGGHANNAGCPEPPQEPPAGVPTPESSEQPATGAGGPNPVQPPDDGPCQLVTASTLAVNVRDMPNLSAAVVGSLDPNMIYPVLGAMLSEQMIWYKVEAGWVSGDVVKIGGGPCPIATNPSGQQMMLVGPLLTYPNGDVCLPFHPANSSICPGDVPEPEAPMSVLVLGMGDPVPVPPDTDGSTAGNAYTCGSELGSNVFVCTCTGAANCHYMFKTACSAGEDSVEMTCWGDVCGCGGSTNPNGGE